MMQMKTLTVNGTTYAVTDEAAQKAIATAQKAIGDLSHLQTPEKADLTQAINSVFHHSVQTLCPAFTKSGDVILCQPVAGYPLEVITHIPATEDGVTSLTLNRAGRNLLKTTYSGGTIRGITCTANDDGTYTFNGTATADTNFDVFTGTSKTNIPMFREGMALSGCPEGGSASTYYLCLPYVGYYDYGRGMSVVYNAGHAKTWTSVVRITIKAGQTVENLVFKPQITAGRTLYPFEPYEGEEKTVTFDVPVYGGTYNWTTGVLTDENGQTHFLAPQTITGGDGTNSLYSRNCEIEVNGRADVKAILEKLIAEEVQNGD